MREIRDLKFRIEQLEIQLSDYQQIVEAISSGEVDAFAINKSGKKEVFTLESSDYVYRLLIEESGEGAINVSEEGVILYTNKYFCNLLGLQYEKVIGKSIFSFIDYDLRDSFALNFNEAILGQFKGETILFSNNTVIPVYASLSSLQPHLPSVGIIITDLTEKKNNEKMILAYQKSLELKNSSLGKMNNELQSFAHISSHDLQEPVRKIQMISSRILDTEYNNLTEHGKDLLLRMQNSAKRMFSLINDLLAYSTTDYESDKFENVSLKNLIDEVLDDFSEDIIRYHIVISTKDLCMLHIIPLHFRQVMHNLISNSIKFSRSEVNPEINISCTSGIGSEQGIAGLNPNTNYCKITYKDNGIGFDPEYNEKIFGLFQRLHVREKYKGTGIGLSIVKKIIENHNGIIIADGNPGSGAQFDIYLPQPK